MTVYKYRNKKDYFIPIIRQLKIKHKNASFIYTCLELHTNFIGRYELDVDELDDDYIADNLEKLGKINLAEILVKSIKELKEE